MTWRKTYDRGTRVKDGQVSQGSGTTPTLVGAAASPGGGSIAITDNADPQMNVLVFRRGKAGPGRTPLCRQPIFPAGEGADENSLIAVPGGLVAENNYGYQGPGPADGSIPDRRHHARPGQGRGGLRGRRMPHRLAQHHRADPDRGQQAESRQRADLRLHTPGRRRGAHHLPVPEALMPDAWFFTAFSARTGKQVWSKYTGSGFGYNNNYAPVSLGPDGTAYVGTLGGLLRIADTR